MRKILLGFTVLCSMYAGAQSNVLPAKPQTGIMYIKNATIHVGDGKVIENGTIKIKDGKIQEVGANIAIPAGDVNVVDVKMYTRICAIGCIFPIPCIKLHH